MSYTPISFLNLPPSLMFTTQRVHSLLDSSSGKELSRPGCTLMNTFEYDGQDRLSRMRPANDNTWQYFTYAP